MEKALFILGGSEEIILFSWSLFIVGKSRANGLRIYVSKLKIMNMKN